MQGIVSRDSGFVYRCEDAIYRVLTLWQARYGRDKSRPYKSRGRMKILTRTGEILRFAQDDNGEGCHPERSEGSLTALKMTAFSITTLLVIETHRTNQG